MESQIKIGQQIVSVRLLLVRAAIWLEIVLNTQQANLVEQQELVETIYEANTQHTGSRFLTLGA